MGNSTSKTSSSSSSNRRRSSRRSSSRDHGTSSSNQSGSGGTGAAGDSLTSRAQQLVGESYRDLQMGIQSGIKKLEQQDHPAASLLDTICSPYLDIDKGSFYSSDNDNENDSHTVSEDETASVTYNGGGGGTSSGGGDGGRGSRRSTNTDKDATSSNRQSSRGGGLRNDDRSMGEGESYMSTSDYESVEVPKSNRNSNNAHNSKAAKESTDDDSEAIPVVHYSKKPLASSFAKRCFFTKAGIGGQTQHYEGLTLTGNVVLMLAQAMKLKGCPTICDEDLRRVEQTYPNQFSRLPDELLLSSGWRRISKYCHFSNKPIPDGVPFFHSKQRLHPSGGYYFLLAAAVGMVRPIDVEPLTRDTLVLLETDYPTACDSAPDILINDPDQWTLVDKFCFFSGGPINQEEDVYYQADFDGNPIHMLAFLSPSLTPAELYKLDSDNEPLTTVAAVQEVESVYDLTSRDFDDLKLYHLGPCRALPQYILQPQAWTKVLPPHFLAARQTALLRAQEFEGRQQQQLQMQQQQHHRHLVLSTPPPPSSQQQHHHLSYPEESYYEEEEPYDDYARQVEEEGAFPIPSPQQQQQQHLHQQVISVTPVSAVEESAPYDTSNSGMHHRFHHHLHDEDEVYSLRPNSNNNHFLPQHPQQRMDPPEDEPPSLKRDEEETYYHDNSEVLSPNQDWGGAEEEEEVEEEDYYESAMESAKYYVDAISEEPPFSTDGATSPSVMSPTSENDFVVSPDTNDNRSSTFQQSPRRNSDLPPTSPRSGNSDTYSQHSTAMKGAQELLRQNRLRRAAAASNSVAKQPRTTSTSAAASTEQQPSVPLSISQDTRDEEGGAGLTSPHMDPESPSTTWESGSDFTGSSVWTDGSAPDRSSRRALILQMAKARMKSNKKTEEKKMDELDLGDLD